MGEFTARVAIVTGASEGIGRALALELAREGARLVLAARDRGRLESLATEVRALGAECLVAPTDVADRAACEALVATTLAAYGAIDTVVCNAGVTMWARFGALSDLAVFERLLHVNYLGAVWLAHAALPALKASRGRLVAVASVAGLTGVPERTAYAASKHALVGFCDSLRIELADTGVTVTVVAPDFVVTKAHERATGADGRPLGASPLRRERVMTAEACARLMVPAIAQRRRLVLTSARGRIAYWLKFFAPALVDRIAAKAIARRH